MSELPPTVDWGLVPIHGKFVDYRRNPIEGRITFTPRATRAIDQDNLTIIIGTPFSVDLVDGEFNTEIPATDDPDVTPIDFTYGVKEDFAGGSEYEIEVPIATVGGLDLATLSPLVDPETGVIIVANVVRSDDIRVIVQLTQAEYDAIATPDPETLYVVVG